MNQIDVPWFWAAPKQRSSVYVVRSKCFRQSDAKFAILFIIPGYIHDIVKYRTLGFIINRPNVYIKTRYKINKRAYL